MALAAMYAGRALNGKPHRARRAARASLVLFAILVADAIGRVPVTLAASEKNGVWSFGWATVDVAFRHGVPIALWGLALLGRWRGWLADLVFATAVVIATVATLVFTLVPLPGRGWPF